MNRHLLLLWLAACGTGTADLVPVEGDPSGSSQDELAVGACFGHHGSSQTFLDGGVQRLQACLADAGIPVTLPARPAFDAGLPPLPAFDGGVPGVPAGLLSKCSAGCTCPAGLRCLNPLQQTCPGTLTLCIP